MSLSLPRFALAFETCHRRQVLSSPSFKPS